MHAESVLAAYDKEMRANPPHNPSFVYESAEGVVRALGVDAYILYSKLEPSNVESVISREVSYFANVGCKLEWKVYGHDHPYDLGTRLQAHGFHADEAETLMVADLTKHTDASLGIDVHVIKSHAALRDMIAVNEAAFQEKRGSLFDELASRLHDATLQLFVIYMDGKGVCAGRLELPQSRSFASLWGGGTIPEYRGKGLFRAMVTVRAAEARRLGYHYLAVDARQGSRAILKRLGFISLTSVTGWVIDAAGVDGGRGA